MDEVDQRACFRAVQFEITGTLDCSCYSRITFSVMISRKTHIDYNAPRNMECTQRETVNKSSIFL